MPRVSEEHLVARRQQIVDAAARCFSRNGFHQTSMQDVIKEAGLSVGAFYRYFGSKTELISAIAGEKISQVLSTVDQLLTIDPLPPLAVVLDGVLTRVDEELGDQGPVRIAVQVWGEAVHDRELAVMVAGIYGTVRERASVLAAHAQAAGQLPAEADPKSVGAALFGLIQGYILQRVLVGEIDRARYIAGVSALFGSPAIEASSGPAPAGPPAIIATTPPAA